MANLWVRKSIESLKAEASQHDDRGLKRTLNATNLVMLGIAEVRLRLSRPAGKPEAEWQANLPEAPMDMRFYAKVLRSMFSKTEIVQAVLGGQSLAQASGWDA